jgi:hypothetical protein
MSLLVSQVTALVMQPAVEVTNWHRVNVKGKGNKGKKKEEHTS